MQTWTYRLIFWDTVDVTISNSMFLRVCELKCTCSSALEVLVCKEWIHHCFQSFDMWLRGGEGKSETSSLITPDSPSPLPLTGRLISYLHQSALSLWHQSVRMSDCSSSLKSKSVHPLDPIGHTRQHHLVWTDKIKKKGSPSEVWPSNAVLPEKINVRTFPLGVNLLFQLLIFPRCQPCLSLPCSFSEFAVLM